MKALLLAGGLGTRLRPVTDSVPKCLVPIRGKALLDYWLEMLTEAGVGPFIINLHYLPDQVRAHIAAGPFRDRILLSYEAELLGTGGTILNLREQLAGGPFMVIHADNLSRFDVRAFMAAHANRPTGCELTMLTFETDRPESCGILERDARGVVQAFHEKVANPPSRLANGAVYILEPSLLDLLAGMGKPVIDLSTEVIPRLMGKIMTYDNRTYHRDIGTLESLAQAQEDRDYLVDGMAQRTGGHP